MNDWTVKDVDTGDVWHKDSKRECEKAVDEFGDVRNLEIISPEGHERANIADDGHVVEQGGKPPEEKREAEVVSATVEKEEIPDAKPSIDEDPIEWMPSHFVDEIQGVPTLNRKGYAVMAEQFNVSAKAEPIVRASESDFEYAEYKGIAVTDDGVEYTDVGSAHVERMDGDDKYLLNELAATRAKKRAASWALGLGMTAREEMTNQL